MAEAGKELRVLGLPSGDAVQWPLQRYGRFMPSGAGEPPESGLEAGTASSPTWKVFDSNEESGYLVLTIVISGHFFISQGQTLLILCLFSVPSTVAATVGAQRWSVGIVVVAGSHRLATTQDRVVSDVTTVCTRYGNTEDRYLFRDGPKIKIVFLAETVSSLRNFDPLLSVIGPGTEPDTQDTKMKTVLRLVEFAVKEGFSLIGSKNWLKIVRRMDCLLFGTTIKNKSRMFRVQFSGESKARALEQCCSCVRRLAQYIVVQGPDGTSPELPPRPGPLRVGDSQGKGCEQSVPLQHASHQCLEQQCVPAGTSAAGRTSVTWLAQSLLASEKLPLAYEQSAWNMEELGPFLRLCLMDQNFPAFVEEVEKELKKLTGLRN